MGYFRLRILFPLILISILFIFFFFQIKGLRSKKETSSTGIQIDSLKREVVFNGRIEKDTGWVQHLIYLEGYKWLKENSAIVSSVRLKDLQLSLASLDFYLWDSLYQRVGGKERIDLFIEGIPAESLILTKEKLSVGDFLFLGSPQFDEFALEGIYSSCERCPFLGVERKSFEKLFIRNSGKRGYYLNKRNFPKKEKVKIRLKIK
uniref:Uncharacterized protein n=1 Tax=candidate division WOR-3 bacterium TaxID=2052148 RepID=A0A7C3UQF1_UNCW3